MIKSKILIIGDSFAADWTVKYPNELGWPNMLAKKYDITNLSQAGVGEYKILKQLFSVTNIDAYDVVIVSHTSPYRIHTTCHPVHSNDLLHKNADLMLEDLTYHATKFKNFFNSALKCALNFFKYYVDIEHQETVYLLLRSKINLTLQGKPVIVVNHLEHLQQFCTENIVLDYSVLRTNSPGFINHVSAEANHLICEDLILQIDKILNNNKGVSFETT